MPAWIALDDLDDLDLSSVPIACSVRPHGSLDDVVEFDAADELADY